MIAHPHIYETPGSEFSSLKKYRRELMIGTVAG